MHIIWLNKAHFLSQKFLICCVYCSIWLNRTSHKQKVFAHLWFCTTKCQSNQIYLFPPPNYIAIYILNQEVKWIQLMIVFYTSVYKHTYTMMQKKKSTYFIYINLSLYTYSIISINIPYLHQLYLCLHGFVLKRYEIFTTQNKSQIHSQKKQNENCFKLFVLMTYFSQNAKQWSWISKHKEMHPVLNFIFSFLTFNIIPDPPPLK